MGHEGKTDVPAPWRRWVAENRMRNADEGRIISTLVQNGIEESAARQEVESVVSHPYFQAGAKMAQRLAKLECLLGVYHDLSAQSSRATTVERRSSLTPEDFLENYYSANRPVILTGVMRNWAPLSWNPEYLKKVCGDETVEVMTGRDSDPHYEANAYRHRTEIRFRDYVDMVTRGGESNDYYLVANNNFFERGAAKQLYHDLVPLPEYLDIGSMTQQVFFWFGPAGTITPLHHDTMNILVAQVYGRKRVTLVSPNQSHLLYNELGVYSDVDLENPDYERHPLFKKAQVIELVLSPGEMLFLPVGWWHHIRALDVSITLSFKNFVYPNSFHWKHPRRMPKAR